MRKFSFKFKRKEVKYRIPEEVYPEFIRRMDPYIRIDEYGLSTISSLYYDDADNDLIINSMEKPKYKEKLRIRSYGTPEADSTVFVELKKKYDGIVYKRREAMTYREATDFLDRGIHPDWDSQILREIEYFRDFYHLRPALLIAYDREAFEGRRDKTLRMTIDRNIRYRQDELELANGSAGHLLDMNGDVLLEVKANGGLPLPVVRIFDDLKIYPASFSKYANVYAEINRKQKDPAPETADGTGGVTRPAGKEPGIGYRKLAAVYNSVARV